MIVVAQNIKSDMWHIELCRRQCLTLIDFQGHFGDFVGK